MILLFLFFLNLPISDLGVYKSCASLRAPNHHNIDSVTNSALPYSAAIALVHYANSTITPQQNKEELMITAKILSKRSPCNFLVYGLGFDSILWHTLNHGGRTVFLEENSEWLETMAKDNDYLEAYHVNYTTVLSEADELLSYARSNGDSICSSAGINRADLRMSDCKLVIKSLPSQIYDVKWDVIMIDAPTGFFPRAPGRMGAIFTSAVMAMAKLKGVESTDVLLHDVDRPVEKNFGLEFLCPKNLVESVGRLWHFNIPGEATPAGGKIAIKTSFCS